MDNKIIRIAMADDHKMVAEALATILQQNERIQVLGVWTDGNKFLQYLNGHSSEVDVAVLDIYMPQLDGLTTIPIIKTRFPNIKIVILSMYYTPQILEQVRSAGADAFVHKADDVELLLKRIEEVVEGKKVLPPYQVSNNTYTNEVPADAFMKIANLTEREKQIARLIRDGLTTPKIAVLLHLSEYTVDTHRKNILQKMQLKSTADLIKFATENRL